MEGMRAAIPEDVYDWMRTETASMKEDSDRKFAENVIRLVNQELAPLLNENGKLEQSDHVKSLERLRENLREMFVGRGYI